MNEVYFVINIILIQEQNFGRDQKSIQQPRRFKISNQKNFIGNFADLHKQTLSGVCEIRYIRNTQNASQCNQSKIRRPPKRLHLDSFEHLYNFYDAIWWVGLLDNFFNHGRKPIKNQVAFNHLYIVYLDLI